MPFLGEGDGVEEEVVHGLGDVREELRLLERGERGQPEDVPGEGEPEQLRTEKACTDVGVRGVPGHPPDHLHDLLGEDVPESGRCVRVRHRRPQQDGERVLLIDVFPHRAEMSGQYLADALDRDGRGVGQPAPGRPPRRMQRDGSSYGRILFR